MEKLKNISSMHPFLARMYADKTRKQDNKKKDVVWTQGRQDPTEGRGEGDSQNDSKREIPGDSFAPGFRHRSVLGWNDMTQNTNITPCLLPLLPPQLKEGRNGISTFYSFIIIIHLFNEITVIFYL